MVFSKNHILWNKGIKIDMSKYENYGHTGKKYVQNCIDEIKSFISKMEVV